MIVFTYSYIKFYGHIILNDNYYSLPNHMRSRIEEYLICLINYNKAIWITFTLLVISCLINKPAWKVNINCENLKQLQVAHGIY